MEYIKDPKVGGMYFLSNNVNSFYMRTETGERLDSLKPLELDKKEPFLLLEEQIIKLPSEIEIFLTKILTKKGIFYINTKHVDFFEV